MKRNKTICIDDDIIEKLKQENASQLINDLLIDYFAVNKESNKLNPIPLQNKMEELKQEQEIMDVKIEQQKKINAIPLDPLVKNWFIKIKERPTLNALIAFLDVTKLPRKDCMGMLQYWDEIHN